MRETSVTTDDGRVLKVLEAGDQDGFPVFVHHGTPSSRLLYGEHVEDATRRGIRLISHDRPGYGGSSRRRGRSVADVAEDVATIAAAFGIDRFASWGISGGGPHVLACAALLKGRCVAAASLASIAPYDYDDDGNNNMDGFDYFDGMGKDNVVEFKLALAGEEGLRPRHEADRRELVSAGREALVASMRTLLSPVDEAAMTGEAADYIVSWMNEGLAPGVDGWLDDDLAFVRPWGFDLSSIEVPVLLWQGRQDHFVPYGHGRWLAERIPGVDARLRDEEGHLTLLLTKIGETHEWLLAHA